ncbi:pentatricopeptide repeat-containing protein At3g22690-like [Rosa rugosa]|uniref:pentatricopeptide repeat-containing protein At3g22690-like n=1 Tax=Rosa rugosa TaxID=74645 RepID=UPI002B4134AA|nr:pentatricopeptide repeat-containing protein At3g22690-like [Rosa rugosa]
MAAMLQLSPLLRSTFQSSRASHLFLEEEEIKGVLFMWLVKMGLEEDVFVGDSVRNMPKEAVFFVFERVAAEIKPNLVTMVCVISACAKLKDASLSERLCAYIGEPGLKCNMLMGLAREAVSVMGEMLQQGLRPDKVTMLSGISACAQPSDSLSGKCCHGYVLRNGVEGWGTICNSMIDMYMKCGQQEMACRIFDNMSNKTVVSWNSLISGFIRSGDVKSAWIAFSEMPKSDLVCWNTTIDALVQESKFGEAIELFWVMWIEGIKGDRVTMVEVASTCGYLGALDLAKLTHAYIQNKKHSL